VVAPEQLRNDGSLCSDGLWRAQLLADVMREGSALRVSVRESVEKVFDWPPAVRQYHDRRATGCAFTPTAPLVAYWHGPMSVQTTPHGQPVAPGAHVEYEEQFLQLPSEQNQLCPVVDTCMPATYARQLLCE
jgi:hypothetical protein